MWGASHGRVSGGHAGGGRVVQKALVEEPVPAPRVGHWAPSHGQARRALVKSVHFTLLGAQKLYIKLCIIVKRTYPFVLFIQLTPTTCSYCNINVFSFHCLKLEKLKSKLKCSDHLLGRHIGDTFSLSEKSKDFLVLISAISFWSRLFFT